MGSGAIKQALAASKSALDRLKDLEAKQSEIIERHNAFVGQVEELAKGLENRFRSVSEVLAALVNLTGGEKVTEELNKVRETKRAADVAQAKAAMDEMVLNGTLKPVDAVDDKTIIVCHEVSAEGKDSGRIQQFVSSMQPEFQSMVLGKKAGDVIDTPANTKLYLDECYTMNVEAIAEEVAAANSEPVVEAPAPPVLAVVEEGTPETATNV